MTCAVLFAKAPVPGTVKTRLQSHLSPATAAGLYTAFLRDAAATLEACSARRKIIAYAPAGGDRALRSLLGEAGTFDYLPQVEGDLGARMREMLRVVFHAGAERAVLIGSDSPSLPPSRLDEAFERLLTADVVIGPTVDGGYYLVGMRADAYAMAAPGMFGPLAWSTGSVLEQTLAAIPDRLRLGLLAPWYDVDHPPEAAFLRTHLQALARAGDPGAGRHTREALRGLELPPPS